MKRIQGWRVIGLALCGSLSSSWMFGCRAPNVVERPEVAKKLRAESGKPLPIAPDKAWEQDFLATRDPSLGYPPTRRLLEAYEKAKSASAAQGAAFVWQSRGPYDVSGRTRVVMFDPNDPNDKKVWSGGVTGGLWFIDDVTDPSAVWSSVDDFWENLSVTAMAHDPTDTQVFYVGTGEGWGLATTNGTVGVGLWKSTDGGTSWGQLPATTDFKYVNDVIVRDEGGQGVLYVAVDATVYSTAPSNNNQGLYRSTDGGQTFAQVLPDVSGSPFAPADIELGADNRIHVGTLRNPAGNGGGVALYSDDGLSWAAQTLLPGGRRVELAAAPSSAAHVYALVESEFQLGAVKRSTNGGVTWQDAPVAPVSNFANFQAWYDLILTVDPSDPLKVFAAAVRLRRSKDGMTSWSPITTSAHADYHALVYRPGSSSELILGTDGGVYYMPNAQAASPTVSKRNDGYNITQFYSCAVHPDAGVDYYLGGAQDNGTEVFQGPGVVVTQGVVGGDGMFCFINQLDPTYQIASTILNTYYRSVNGGSSFSVMDNLGGGLFVNPADYDANQDILYSSRDGQTIHRISGITGTPVASTISVAIGSGFGTYASAFEVSPYTTGSTTLFVGTQVGRLFKITKANTGSPSLTEITGAAFPTGNISAIEIGASENELKVVFSNYGVTSVWHTTDGGTQWASKEGNLPDMPVRWLVSNPVDGDEVLLATEVGVWRTTDFFSVSPDWQPANTGLANVRIDMLQVRPSDNLVVAATHGRGLFSSTSFNGVVSAGSVPDGDAVPGTPLTLVREPGGDITLSWGTTCIPTDTDYAVYEGSVGDFAGHTDRVCSTGGLTTQTLTAAAGDTYYLVVPTNGTVEGSYGTDSEGAERPQGPTSCTTQVIATCPAE